MVSLRDPGSTTLGRRLRQALLHSQQPLTPLQEALLFIGGRVALVKERIIPELRKGKVVLCDRFHDSTLAYQGFGGRMNIAWLDRLGRRAIDELMPDLTLILDVPAEVGLRRLRHVPDRMERYGLAFHRRVRRGFHDLSHQEPHRFVVIDATQPAKIVQEKIRCIVSERLAGYFATLQRSR